MSLDDWTNAAGEPVRFGGGKLTPDLSWPKLRARWEPATNPPTPAGAGEQTPGRAGAEAPQPPPRGPLSDDEAQQVWREAERVVREAAARITAEARSDPDAAADAAWAASDTLSAAAAGLEGQAGGPLTDAAEAFDRAGREAYRRLPARSDTGAALRAAGRMVALLASSTHHSEAQVAALTTALAALAAAVADLRQSQQRLHQAQAARVSAERLRTVAPMREPATAASRPRTAADLAGLSYGSKPFRPPHPKSSTDKERDANLTDPLPRRTPERGRGRGPTR